jgi:hypothetical protein
VDGRRVRLAISPPSLSQFYREFANLVPQFYGPLWHVRGYLYRLYFFTKALKSVPVVPRDSILPLALWNNVLMTAFV